MEGFGRRPLVMAPAMDCRLNHRYRGESRAWHPRPLVDCLRLTLLQQILLGGGLRRKHLPHSRLPLRHSPPKGLVEHPARGGPGMWTRQVPADGRDDDEDTAAALQTDIGFAYYVLLPSSSTCAHDYMYNGRDVTLRCCWCAGVAQTRQEIRQQIIFFEAQ